MKEREATSVSSTTARGEGLGKVGVPGPDDEGQELIEFPIGFECITAKFIN